MYAASHFLPEVHRVGGNHFMWEVMTHCLVATCRESGFDSGVTAKQMEHGAIVLELRRVQMSALTTGGTS